jgi:uncharacterized protein
VKLVVEEVESEALIRALEDRGPYLTSVVGELETIRVCRRAGLAPEQVDELRSDLVLVALDEHVRRLAAAVGPPTLRTLEAVHLGTALSLRELDGLITYDVRLAAAASDAGLRVLSPSPESG